MLARAVPLALALIASVSAWLSLGVLAVVDRGTRARVGVLPPWWLLAALMAVFVLTVVLRRLPLVRVLPLALTIFPILPWLPGRIPAAFLIWYGPPAVLVWILVVLGLASPVLASVARQAWWRRPARAPWMAALAAAVMFGAGAFALQSRLPAGDEPHYLIITQSLLADGDLQIENNHTRGDYLPYFSGELRPDYLKRGQNGQIYSVHAPGLSAMLVPAFAVGGYPAAVAAVIMLSAIGVALLWTIVWELTGRAAAAWFASAAWALSAPVYFHAFTIFPDGVGAVGTMVGLWLLVRLDRNAAVGAGRLVATGAVLAIHPWLHTRFAVIAGAIGLVLTLRLLARPDRVRCIGWLMAVPALSAAAWFGFFWFIWGTPNPAAPYGGYTQSGWSNVVPGLAGLLLDQQFGLLGNAPIYGLAILGMGALARRHPRLAFDVSVLVVPYAVAVAAYQMWWGGYSAPARFLVAVLPAAVLPLGVLWSRAGAGLRAVLLLLLVLGAALTLTRVFADDGALLYNARDGFDLLLDWANRSVNLPFALPSLHRDVLADALADAATWLLAAGLLGTVAAWLSGRFGSAWTLVCGSAALTVMVAATLVWSSHDHGYVTPGTAALDLLHRWSSSWHAVGWQSRPFGVLAANDVPGRLELTSTTRGPARRGPPPLFTAPLLPAGEYEVTLAGALRPEGQLTATIGRVGGSIDVIALAEADHRRDGLVIRLPVRVHSLTIEGDARARETIDRLALRPRLVRDGDTPESGKALLAARYGAVRAFFLDDNVFVESPGFWTRGETATDLVVDTGALTGTTNDALPVLTLRAGAVATGVRLSSGGWARTLSLEAGELQSLDLPPRGPSGVWPLRIETGLGFRPAVHEPGSRDFRNLGVWVEFPGTSTAPASGAGLTPPETPRPVER